MYFRSDSTSPREKIISIDFPMGTCCIDPTVDSFPQRKHGNSLVLPIFLKVCSEVWRYFFYNVLVTWRCNTFHEQNMLYPVGKKYFKLCHVGFGLPRSVENLLTPGCRGAREESRHRLVTSRYGIPSLAGSLLNLEIPFLGWSISWVNSPYR